MRIKKSTYATGVVLVMVAGIGRADLVTFKDGSTNQFTGGAAYTGAQDTMVDGVIANQGKNYGATTTLNVGLSAKKALIRFDVAGLAGQYSDVASVTLRLRASDSVASTTVNVWRVSSANAGWVEGDQNGLTSTGGAAWTFASITGGPTTNAWAGSLGLGTSGTDYVSPYDQQIVISTAGWMEFTWTGAAAKSLIDSWAGGTNAGLLVDLAGTGDLGTNFRIISAEYVAGGTPNLYSPELVVNYTAAIPEPTTISLFVISAISILWVRKAFGH